MSISRLGRMIAPCFSTIVLATLAISTAVVHGQIDGPPRPNSIIYKVQSASERLEMTVKTSRILTLEEMIPKFVVNDPDKVKVTPLSAKQLQIVALKPGVTQVNLWTINEETKKETIYTIDVIVFGDARELAMVLETEFPNSSLKVRPLSQNVIISGYVDRPDYVSRIHRIAEEYYPNVIDNITVGGVQQVQLHCKVMEVSRTKLRRMGFDFANISGGGSDFLFSSVSGLIQTGTATFAGAGAETMQFGVVGDSGSFFGYLDLLRQYDLAKILSEPTLTTVSGRPAFFESGGEFPILVAQPLGVNTLVWKKFGTRLDFVPIVLGNGNVRLEVRTRVSERDVASGINGTPAIRLREVDTGAELQAGQTLVLAGLLQYRLESQDQGVPWLADLPWLGAAFRNKEEKINEIELVIMVTPELVDGMAAEQVPPGGPGMSTTSPCDVDFYWRGYMEVPNHHAAPAYNGGQGYEELPPQPAPESKSDQIEDNDAPLPEAEGDARYDDVPGNGFATPEGTISTTGSSRRRALSSERALDDSAANGYARVGPYQTASRPNRPPRYDRFDENSRYSQRQDQRYERPPAARSLENTPGMIGPIGYDKVD